MCWRQAIAIKGTMLSRLCHHTGKVRGLSRVCTFAREAVYVLPSSLAFAIIAFDSGSTLFFSLSRICAVQRACPQLPKEHIACRPMLIWSISSSVMRHSHCLDVLTVH